MNPVSWNRVVKYIKLKDARSAYNTQFIPLFSQVKQEMREEGVHESVLQERAKKKTKELIKAKSLTPAPAEQSYKESQSVLPEAD
jgi:hypothetical protein